MNKIQIVHYGNKWEESHQKFAKKYYNNRRKRVIPEYIYWKFRSKKESIQNEICFKYETNLVESLKKKPSDYLKDLYYDAIIYNNDCLKLLVKSVGNDKIMFGTDHPFFPPINNNDNNWESTTKIQNIITNLENKTSNKIFFENAKNLFNI